MATKRKSKTKAAAAPAAPTRRKPAKARKRKSAPKRKRAAAATGSAKRTRRPLQLVLRVEDVPINSPSLSRLSDSQRVDLAAMSAKRTFSTRPAWVLDDAAWRRAIRTVGPHWARLRHPWPTVAWVYLHSDGPVASDGRRGLTERETDQPRRRARAARPAFVTGQAAMARANLGGSYDDTEETQPVPVRVERLRVDETGIDDAGNYRGRGLWWRVWNASMDSIVRAASASAARAIVTGRA